MTTPWAIELTSVEKTFRRRALPGGYTTLKSRLVETLTGKGRRAPDRSLTVLRNIDLAVPRGSTLGVIGQNGSGKSTLLKLLAGIYRPTSGRIQIDGRLSALIELGAGFHPEFSGLENIYINGIILGRSRREMDRLVDEIVDFAELANFIEEPVRTYSSGMYMRLAFAVATLVDPDILVIDEILAVGDEHFQRKSSERMKDFKRRGKTMVLVTHDAGVVQTWCDLAVWLDRGQIAAQGSPVDVIAAYRRAVAAREQAGGIQAGSLGDLAPEKSAAVTGSDVLAETGGWIRALRLVGPVGEASRFTADGPLTVEIQLDHPRSLAATLFSVAILQGDVRLWGTESHPGRAPTQTRAASATVSLRIDRLGLFGGDYRLEVVGRTLGETTGEARAQLPFAVAPGREAGESGLFSLPSHWHAEESVEARGAALDQGAGLISAAMWRSEP